MPCCILHSTARTAAYQILNGFDRSGRSKAWLVGAKAETKKLLPEKWNKMQKSTKAQKEFAKAVEGYAIGLQSGIALLPQVDQHVPTFRLDRDWSKPGAFPEFLKPEYIEKGVKGTYSTALKPSGALAGAAGSDVGTADHWMQIVLSEDARVRKAYGSAYGAKEGEHLFPHGTVLYEQMLLERPDDHVPRRASGDDKDGYIRQVKKKKNADWLKALKKRNDFAALHQYFNDALKAIHPTTKRPFEGRGFQIVSTMRKEQLETTSNSKSSSCTSSKPSRTKKKEGKSVGDSQRKSLSLSSQKTKRSKKGNVKDLTTKFEKLAKKQKSPKKQVCGMTQNKEKSVKKEE